MFHPTDFKTDGLTAWKTASIRKDVRDPEDCLAVTDSQSPPIPIAASSLQARDLVWEIRSVTGLSTAHHGAAVISTKDGKLIGQLLFDRGKATIATIPMKP